MKRKLICSMVGLLIAIFVGGCSADVDISLNEDGSGEMTETIMIEKEYIDQGWKLNDDIEFTEVTVDGVQYMKGIDKQQFRDFTELEGMEDYNVEYGRDRFLLKLDGANTDVKYNTDAVSQVLEQTWRVKFPYEVKASSGEIQPDGRTVVWDSDNIYGEFNMWAVFDEALLDTNLKAPVLSGVTDGKIYNKTVKIEAISDTIIDSFIVNGMTIGSDVASVQHDGKYEVQCRDINGKTTKLSFAVDKTKPTVTGIKNGKTYKSSRKIEFSDANGIKKATLNGKKINNGKKVSAKGKYELVVTDNAGNSKKVKFSIK